MEKLPVPTPSQRDRLGAILKQLLDAGDITIADMIGQMGEVIGGSVFADCEPLILVNGNNYYPFARGSTARLSKSAAMALGEWLQHYDLADVRAEMRSCRILDTENLVSLFRDFFGHGGEVDEAKARPFHGVFDLYRPLHLRPRSHFTIASLKIGQDLGPFDCKLVHRFTDFRGEETEHVFEGKIIPHEKRATLLMRGRNNSKFYMYVDRVDQPFTEAVPWNKEFSGVMVAAAGSEDLASCWPFLARRTSKKNLGPDYTNYDYNQIPIEDEPLRQTMSRGAVHWNPMHFGSPPPFSQASAVDLSIELVSDERPSARYSISKGRRGGIRVRLNRR